MPEHARTWPTELEKGLRNACGLAHDRIGRATRDHLFLSFDIRLVHSQVRRGARFEGCVASKRTLLPGPKA